jgi:hypothetical protein
VLLRRPGHGVAVAFALLLTGCAGAGRAWRAGPAGIPIEQNLRTQMAAGQYGSAWEALKQKKIAPADALLRHMYRGVVGLHAGQLDDAAQSMDRAWSTIYERWTKRVSDGAAAMLAGDAALPYYPGPAERVFVPYYGALTWLARNDRQSAAIEVRRLSFLLASDEGVSPSKDFLGVMRYVAGVMYEVAGEQNDADVSFRNATALLGPTLPGDTIPPDAQHGDVVLIIEDGFVAHPEPASLLFWFRDNELDALKSDDYDRRSAAVTLMGNRRHESRKWEAEQYRSVSVRWPTMDPALFKANRSVIGARALASTSDSGGGVTRAATIAMSVSDAVRADFDRRQPGRLARAVARAALREATLKGTEGAFKVAGAVARGDGEKKEAKKDETKKDETKKDETEKSKSGESSDSSAGSGKWWMVAGAILAGIGMFAIHARSQVLDQPDLRAWQLLPDRVTVARMRLPVGEYPIEVTRDQQECSLGRVTVRPGSVTVLTHRWWPSESGCTRPVRAAPGAALDQTRSVQ